MRLSSQSCTHVLHVLQNLISILSQESIEGRLWTIDETAVRIHGGAD